MIISEDSGRRYIAWFFDTLSHPLSIQALMTVFKLLLHLSRQMEFKISAAPLEHFLLRHHNLSIPQVCRRKTEKWSRKRRISMKTISKPKARFTGRVWTAHLFFLLVCCCCCFSSTVSRFGCWRNSWGRQSITAWPLWCVSMRVLSADHRPSQAFRL